MGTIRAHRGHTPACRRMPGGKGDIIISPSPLPSVYHAAAMSLPSSRLILNTWAHAPERVNKVADAAPIDPHNRDMCVEEILRLVTGGTYLRDACEAVGVGRDTFLAWRLKDAALSQRYFEARASWALVRLDDALEQLAHATTNVAAARWRTIVQALQWETERLLVQYRHADEGGKASEPTRTVVIRWESSPLAPGDDAVVVLDAAGQVVADREPVGESPESGIFVADSK